jgi:hypothetical protein
MRRSHRTVHRLLWPLLAVALLIGITMALILRPPPEKSVGTQAIAGLSA